MKCTTCTLLTNNQLDLSQSREEYVLWKVIRQRLIDIFCDFFMISFQRYNVAMIWTWNVVLYNPRYIQAPKFENPGANNEIIISVARGSAVAQW